MLGRLIASQVVKRVRGPQLLLGCSVGAIAGLLLMALAPNVWIATAGIVLCGLCYAPVFPTTAGTASTYFSRIFGTVFGMLMTLALLSGAVVPPAIGYVAQHQSVRAGIWILVGIAVLLLVTQGIFNRYERRKLLPPGLGKSVARTGFLGPRLFVVNAGRTADLPNRSALHLLPPWWVFSSRAGSIRRRTTLASCILPFHLLLWLRRATV